MHALNLITTVISNVEVFAEGVSNLCGSTAYKNFVVLIVEASKASCRLISMMSSQSNTMLLNWGKADNATSVQPDVSDYLAHYKSACDKILRNLHAKSPTLFQISSNRPVSFRLNSTAAASAMLSVSSVSGSYASPTGVSAASRTMLGNNGKTAAAAVDEKGNKEPFLGR